MAVETVQFPAGWPVGARTGSYPIPLVRTTVVGFLGKTDRGPLNEPVVVRSFSEFCQVFGSHCAASTMSFAVQDYFLHGGGKAVIVRVANRALRAHIDVPAGSQFLRLQARYPGRQEILRVSIDHERVESDPTRFNLVVQRLRNAGSALVADQELYPLVSMRPSDERFLVDAIQSSKLISLNGPLPATRPDATTPDRPGESMKYIGMSRAGTDGDELTDYDIIGSNREGTGLFAFGRAPRLDLLCIPPSPARDFGMTAFLAAERYCARMRVMLIWDPPWAWETFDHAVLSLRRAECASQNVISYFPRIRPRGESARHRHGLPACGAIAGMLARQDRRGQWQATADYALKASLTAMVDVTDAQAAVLRRLGINSFVRGTGSQTRLKGNVLLGGSDMGSRHWHGIDRRRLYLFVVNTVEEAAGWAAEHFVAGETGVAFESQVRTFLKNLYEWGALSGDTPEKSFFVEISSSQRSTSAFVLHLGVALERANDFATAAVEVDSHYAALVRLPLAIEAEQLFR